MNYYRFSIPLPDGEELTEILIASLADAGFESFEETDDALLAYVPESDYHKDILAGIDYCGLPEVKSFITENFIPDQNWNEVWEKNYPDVMITERCRVRAPFHEPRTDLDFDINIRPKMAFGTAHHETTSQMLRSLLALDVTGSDVLDMGCGSGVLGILASLKGAASVVAIDNDHWSTENSVENADLNGVDNMKVMLGGAELLDGSLTFDLILANINKNILLRDMEAYIAVLRPGGKILFSGFYTIDLVDIEKAAVALGLLFEGSVSENDWTVATFNRP